MTVFSTFIVTARPEFVGAALDELAQMDSSLTLSRRFKEGVFLVESTVAACEFAHRVRDAGAVFVRHLMPVQVVFPISGQRRDLLDVIRRAEAMWRPAQGEPFEVQCRTMNRQASYSARDVEVAVGSHFEALGGVPVLSDLFVDHDPDRLVLSLYLVYETGYLGLSPARLNINDHCDPQRLAASSSVIAINRAELKLKEALHCFGLRPSTGVALDVGAAPGGWSLVLAQSGMSVTALDPAALHPSAASHPRITHARLKADDYSPMQPLDWLVNDMGCEPGESVETLLRFSNWLKPGGIALMTLKFYRYNPDRLLHQMLPRLRQDFYRVQARNLFFNRREVTISAVKPESTRFMA